MTRCGARWRGLACLGVGCSRDWPQEWKVEGRWRDKTAYGWLVAGDCIYCILTASFFASLLAELSENGGFLRLLGMAGIQTASHR